MVPSAPISDNSNSPPARPAVGRSQDVHQSQAGGRPRDQIAVELLSQPRQRARGRPVPRVDGQAGGGPLHAGGGRPVQAREEFADERHHRAGNLAHGHTAGHVGRHHLEVRPTRAIVDPPAEQRSFRKKRRCLPCRNTSRRMAIRETENRWMASTWNYRCPSCAGGWSLWIHPASARRLTRTPRRP